MFLLIGASCLGMGKWIDGEGDNIHVELHRDCRFLIILASILNKILDEFKHIVENMGSIILSVNVIAQHHFVSPQKPTLIN